MRVSDDEDSIYGKCHRTVTYHNRNYDLAAASLTDCVGVGLIVIMLNI